MEQTNIIFPLEASQLYEIIEDLITSRNHASLRDSLEKLDKKMFEHILSSPSGVKDNFFPLHMAARQYDHQSLLILLQAKVFNPNTKDLQERTPLHIVLFDGFLGHLNMEAVVQCIKILVEYNADINAEDKNGWTPFHMAVENQFPKCISILLKSGAETTTNNLETGKKSRRMVSKLALTMPDILLELFDEAVTFKKDINDGTSKIRLNWSAVLQFPCKKGKLIEEQDRKPWYTPKRGQKETTFLYNLLDTKSSTRIRLLNHPLVSAFLHYKHAKVARHLRWLYVAAGIFPLLYMVFIYFLYFHVCPYTTSIHNQTDEKTESTVNHCETTWAISVSAYILTLFIFGLGIIEIFMQLRVDTKYLKSWRNWINRVSIVIMALTLWPGLQFESLDISFQYPIAALGIFFGWVMLLVQIGSHPKFSVYVEMLATILLSVTKICIIFLPLLIGFYMGFQLMFVDVGGVFHFIVMMVDPGTGEYEDVIERTKEKYFWFSAVGYAFCTAFIIIIVIVFMNFVLGTSIDDIQKLKYKAKLSGISQMIQNLFLVDLLDPRCRLVSTDQLRAGEWFFEFSPNDKQCTLTNEVQTKLVQILKTRKNLQDSSEKVFIALNRPNFTSHQLSFGNTNAGRPQVVEMEAMRMQIDDIYLKLGSLSY